MSSGTGGFTYGDFGKVNGAPEVHGDGEIWAETLWDLRAAVGSTNARRLITQGMRLSPPEPSFLDMRNAILQADQAAGASAAHADLDGVRAPRHGLLRRHRRLRRRHADRGHLAAAGSRPARAAGSPAR